MSSFATGTFLLGGHGRAWNPSRCPIASGFEGLRTFGTGGANGDQRRDDQRLRHDHELSEQGLQRLRFPRLADDAWPHIRLFSTSNGPSTGPRKVDDEHIRHESHLFLTLVCHMAYMCRMWTPSEIQALRHRLGVDAPGFARLLGVDARTVSRWELGTARPTGASEAILAAVQEKLHKDPEDADNVVAFVVAAAAVGGLAYLLIKLLDEVPRHPSARHPPAKGRRRV
jgi:DNA-binding transcriptional regulator YiaG